MSGPTTGSLVTQWRMTAVVYELTNTKYFRAEISQTFHGRDVFAPVAAALSNGIQPKQLGKRVSDWVRLAPLQPKTLSEGKLEGRIIHIDRFGNCVTNITRNEIDDAESRLED